MTIPPRFLDELRSRITLSDVIGKRIRLTRAGREFKGCCPFHNEKTPSFYVNDDKQFYHCFGCGAHGSVIDFIMQSDNLSFPEAVEGLALTVNMQVPQSTPQDLEKAKKEKSLYTLLDDAAKWMERQFESAEGKVAHKYMVERGLDEATLTSFRIGYAPGDAQALRKYLTGLGYSDSQMTEAGVLKVSERGKEPYAFFRDRVMFPVPDRRGRIVAFGGRILPEHLRPPERGDFKPPKYINSSDTPLFHKGKMLYGEPHARQAAAEGQAIIVVEGYLDVIACWRAGFRGAVAPLGTALTEDQIMVLWKMIVEDYKAPVLCFDGDNAGRRAASRACERILPLLKPDHSARIAFLPEGEDPDSLIRNNGKESFVKVLDEAMNLVDFLYFDQTEGKSFDTPESRAGLAKSLDDAAGRIADRAVQHFYREAFREKIRAAFAPPRREKQPWQPREPQGQGYRGGMQGGANAQGFSASRAGGRFPQPMLPLSPLKRPVFAKAGLVPMALLGCVLNNPEILGEIEEEFAALDFSENTLDRLRQAVLSTLGANPALDAKGLQNHLIERGFEGELNRVLSDAVYTHASFSRASADPGAVLIAWREAWVVMQSRTALADLEAAKAALKADLSEDNENRLNALREARKSQDV